MFYKLDEVLFGSIFMWFARHNIGVRDITALSQEFYATTLKALYYWTNKIILHTQNEWLLRSTKSIGFKNSLTPFWTLAHHSCAIQEPVFRLKSNALGDGEACKFRRQTRVAKLAQLSGKLFVFRFPVISRSYAPGEMQRMQEAASCDCGATGDICVSMF